MIILSWELLSLTRHTAIPANLVSVFTHSLQKFLPVHPVVLNSVKGNTCKNIQNVLLFAGV